MNAPPEKLRKGLVSSRSFDSTDCARGVASLCFSLSRRTCVALYRLKPTFLLSLLGNLFAPEQPGIILLLFLWAQPSPSSPLFPFPPTFGGQKTVGLAECKDILELTFGDGRAGHKRVGANDRGWVVCNLEWHHFGPPNDVTFLV